MTRSARIPVLKIFACCLIVALLIWFGYQYAWNQRLRRANATALSMLSPSQQSEVLETIKKQSGRCRIIVRAATRRNWCGESIFIAHVDCRFTRGILDRNRAHGGAGNQCAIVAREDGPVAVVDSDISEGCEHFGKVLAYGNPTPNNEEIKEIGTMWQLATPWEIEAFDRGVAFPPNHEYVFEQYSKDVVTWLHVQFDEEGRLLGTSIKYKRLPEPFHKLPL